jgi:ABC-type branched-subunit amino acid transport system substrate-binding protein
MKQFRTALATAIVAALTLVLAGVSATSAAAAGAQANGVTDTTVTLAYPAIDFAALKDVGVNLDRGNTQQIFDTLVEDINAKGGIDGRQVKVNVVKYNLLNPASADSACVAMTEDQKVFAVLDAFAGSVASSNKCITDHKTALFGGDPDPAVAKTTPWVGQFASTARRSALLVQLMKKTGKLKGKTVGVISNQNDAQSVKDVLVPALKKAGTPAKVVLVDDAPAGDTAAADANYKVYAEKLKAEGVNQVILVGSEVSGGFSRLLDNGVKAAVATPNSDQLEGIAKNQTQHKASDYNGALTLGGLSGQETFQQPEIQKCVQTFKKKYPNINVKSPELVAEGETDWATGIIIACNQLEFFQAVADKAGKKLDNASLLAAIKSMTQNFAYGSNQYNTLGPNKFDATNGFRLQAYDASVGATGGLKDLGTLQNLG